MIGHSKRYCINGCHSFVFAKDRCVRCYRKEILYPKQKNKPKQHYKIAPVSDKRQKLNAEYERKKKQKWLELIEQKKNVCFFSNKTIDPTGPVPHFHHTLGRDGDLLSDMNYAFPCYFQPHRQYHDMQYTYDYLEKIDWYFPWLQRMKQTLPIIYYKEMKLIERANAKSTKNTTTIT